MSFISQMTIMFLEDLVFFSDENIRNTRKTICDLYHDDPW